MRLKEFLSAVKEGLDLPGLAEADRVVRVVGALKSALPKEQADAIAAALPGELSTGWEEVAPLPTDIFEREEMYMEVEGPVPPRPETPTITQG